MIWNKMCILLVILSFIVGIYFYPKMPEKMASHWNIKSEVDGYLPKPWGLFLMPMISLIMYGLFLALPKLDPLKENIKKFEKYYSGFIFVLIAFLFYIYILTIEANLGRKFNMGVFIVPGLSLLFFYIGLMLEKSKRNWFIGIRTPWTLHSDRTWEKTHELGGKLFKISSVAILLGIFFPDYTFLIVMGFILLATIIPVFYSYFIYRKESEG